jgi:hypothetical protein
MTQFSAVSAEVYGLGRIESHQRQMSSPSEPSPYPRILEGYPPPDCRPVMLMDPDAHGHLRGG